MIKPLITYPDPTIRLISANVRFFDDELKSYIDDLIDTATANNLNALSGIEIGIQYNIIIIKADSDYDIYINSRIIRHENLTTQTERSRYYPDISADIDRYDFISIVYEDIDGNSHSKELSGDDARVFQIQLDFCFGSTFVDRCDKEMRERISSHLSQGLIASSGACPTIFYRDYFKKFARYSMIMMLLALLGSFFEASESAIFKIEIALVVATIFLIVGYGVYALYESRKYKQCTSCQAGNIVGTIAILMLQLIIVSVLVFIFV